MSTIYNSLNKEFKQPIGPVKKSESLKLRIKLKKYLNPCNVQVVIHEYKTDVHYKTILMDIEKTDEKHIYFKVEIPNLEINIYYYYFTFMTNGKLRFLKMCNDSWSACISESCNSFNWQLTVYEPIHTHKIMSNGTMYQIIIDRLCKEGEVENSPTDIIYRKWGEVPFYTDDMIGKDFFGGNFKGVKKQIKYLKSLGISAIYFNPLCKSSSNHRYNASSYEEFDSLLGTMEEFKELVKTLHDNGIIIILDFVANHAGDDSKYFNKYNSYPVIGAYNSNSSPFYDWFYINPNNHDDYACWWDYKTLPKFNQNNPGYIEYFFGEGGIIDQWYALGIDGLRLDVADELENSTLVRINEASKRNRDSIVIIGEVWDNASNKCNYGHKMDYLLGKELTSVMNYPVKDAILAYIRYGENHAQELKRTLISIFIEDYPKEVAYSLMNFLSSHDTVRAITKLAGKELNEHKDDKEWQYSNDNLSREEFKLGKLRLMIAYMLLFFLPGIPSIFYGDEVGMYGYKDPFCRKCFPWNRIDKKLLMFFRNLSKVRYQHSDFLSKADFHVCDIDDKKCIFMRTFENKSLIVFINRTDSKIDITDNSFDLCFINKGSKKLVKCSFDVNILFSIGKNSDMTSLDPFGAILIEVVQTEK